jgi:hypothetical protein
VREANATIEEVLKQSGLDYESQRQVDRYADADTFIAEVDSASRQLMDALLDHYESHPSGGSLVYYALILSLLRTLMAIPPAMRWPLLLSGQALLFNRGPAL